MKSRVKQAQKKDEFFRRGGKISCNDKASFGKLSEVCQKKEWGREIFVLPVKFYRFFVSPHLLPSCRFVPSCSEYAVLAVKKHGIFKGSALAFWRILRCNPFSKGGYDGVP